MVGFPRKDHFTMKAMAAKAQIPALVLGRPAGVVPAGCSQAVPIRNNTAPDRLPASTAACAAWQSDKANCA